PVQVVLQVDDRHRLAHVRPGPATVTEDASPGGQLPVPDTQEPVWQLDLQPQPQGTAAVVADPPGVIPLAHPTVDTSRDPAHGVGASVAAGLEDVALVPHDVVSGAHRAAPQPVGPGAGREGDV